jgi:integrase
MRRAKLVARGIDPVQTRRAAAVQPRDNTFRHFAEQWMDATRSQWNDRTHSIRKNRLERHIFPEIGAKDIRTIDAAEMLRVIRKIEATGVAELPWRMRADCSAVFEYAIAGGAGVQDPTQSIRRALKKQAPATHRAFIRPEQMGSFLAALPECGIEERTLDALLLTILTASRTVEVRFAHKREFELSGQRPQWRVPAERMKMRREHIVPLSDPVVEIVRRRLAATDGLLFGSRTKSGVISSNTLIFALYRAGWHSRATVHGFRRSFSTWANEATMIVDGQEVPRFAPDWIEWCLAHVPSNKVRAIYNAAEHLPQRRGLLQAWADWLDRERAVAALIG